MFAVSDKLTQYSNAKHEMGSEMQDQIGSGSPTPSGAETPQPDFHDKRLPGILHNYFGQVGKEPSQRSPLRDAQTSTAPAVDCGVSNHTPQHVRKKSRRASESSLGSLVMVERDHQIRTPPPDGQQEAPMQNTLTMDPSRLPPTPISSAASVVQKDDDSAENGKALADSGIAIVTQALRNFVLPRSTFSGKARRHQSLPMSSVTRSTVPAAHLSNPTTCPSSSVQSPQDSPSVIKPDETLQSVQESDGLTLGVASKPREKATPPHTPRALSQEDRQRSPLASDASPQPHIPQLQVQPKEQTQKDANYREDLPANDARGKLAIRIAEGRNMKPAYDPYVVCVFEYNEYVSKGARTDKMDIDGEEDQSARARPMRSIPIRRTDSDMGKPMAIPMRSRQSSTNGTMEEGRNFEKVTDPQWDHEAVL